jgi:hypothetical protein
MIAKRTYILVINPRILQVQGDFMDGLKYEDGEIVSLELPYNGASLTVRKGGLYWMNAAGKQIPYRINSMTLSTDASCLYLETIPSTKSTVFLLPMLFREAREMKFRTAFLSAFVDYEESGIPYGIHLLFRFDPSIEFRNFEEELSKHPNFIKSIDVDKYHVLYCFSIPSEYEEDYYKILNSQYSKTSEKFKKHILAFNGFNTEGETYGILYKTDKIRQKREEEFSLPSGSLRGDFELYDTFETSKETYLNQYKIVVDVFKTTIE